MKAEAESAADPPPHIHDALIIGLGFSGTYLLHKVLKIDYDVVALDPNDQLGGVWNHNTYPGARVDISVPSYQLNLLELHETDPWEWSEKYPSGEELRKYFRWVEKRLGITPACEFGVWVESAMWNDKEHYWTVTASDTRQWNARWLLPCLGYAAAPLMPAWPGLSTKSYPDNVHVLHSAQWPKEGIDLRGKRVGVVGNGASGVQIVQTIVQEVKHLTVFQRTPATAIPMQQEALRPGQWSKIPLPERYAFLENRKSHWDGSPSSVIMRAAKLDTPERRETELEGLWQQGGFSFWTSNYMDLFTDAESNSLAYDFWKRKVRSRIRAQELQELLAPDNPLYAFGTKRVPLEQGYYEAFNFSHVSLVDLGKDEVMKLDSRTIKLGFEMSIDLDVLIFATGFDISTGSFTQIDIRGKSGQILAEKWAERPRSYLGISVAGFPNMLFPYGPQSPSNTCNGPVCAEVQGDFIVGVLEYAKKNGHDTCEASVDAEASYTDEATSLLQGTLFEGTKSYYHRDSITAQQGRKREPVFWMGGLPAYIQKLGECKDNGYVGFNLS